MIVHAYAAYLVVPFHPNGGLPQVEQTVDYGYWVEPLVPNAEALAATKFAELRHTPDVAAFQYRVEVPADVVAAHNDGDNEAIYHFVDGLEWDNDWFGAPIVRQNELGEHLTAATAARRTPKR
jgi:hypothetical protein